MNLIKIKSLIFYIFFCFVISSLLLEVIFRLLPVSDTLSTQNVNIQNPILRYQPNKIITRQTGYNFQHIVKKKINNLGFFNDADFNDSDLNNHILIIGDSYVEALQVENKNTVTGLLNKNSKTLDKKVFSIGVSGSPLSQYLAFAEYAELNLKPLKYIFIIISDDFDESLIKYKNAPGFHYFDENFKLVRKDYSPSTLKKLARKSAFIRYLHLDYKISARISSLFTKKSIEKEKINKNKILLSYKAIDNFNENLQKIVNQKPVLFILDRDRKSIYNQSLEYKSYENEMYDYFENNCCLVQNFNTIDIQNSFKKNYKKNKKRFEFKNDFHWNELGHKIVAEEIIKSGFLDK